MDKTIIKIEKELQIDPGRFIAAWNAQKSNSADAMATRLRVQPSFDADILTWLGDAANLIQIAQFVGVPTLTVIIVKLLKPRGQEPSVEIEYEERTVRDTKYVRVRMKRGVGK